MKFSFTEHTLRPRHAFTISRESIREKQTFFVELQHDGITAHGEAAPMARFGETPAKCRAALNQLIDTMPESPGDWEAVIRSLEATAPNAPAARAAIDAAIMDWIGKSSGAPLYELWSIDPASMPPTSMSIAIDAPERVRERAREASDFLVLKLKLGGKEDHAMVKAVRDVTDAPIRGDANEGYRDREAALREIEWLAEQNVELVEQPLPADRIDDMIWLKQRSPLPLIADEAFMHARDLSKIAEGYNGINIKLVKCGGTLAAREAIAAARSRRLKVMLGCTIESSLGIAAAAHLAPLTDYVDLDGNLLISNDPFEGHPVIEGRIKLRGAPGLGIL
ncbi:MAG: dipeptide epimerase [Gammaproteobacteria bacterium]|nr:dipeptide epimerase [Gammaproteobacteria bacterium]MDH3411425.1 dipeptide epimerase [Gammaproteobacteria bacterium]